LHIEKTLAVVIMCVDYEHIEYAN